MTFNPDAAQEAAQTLHRLADLVPLLRVNLRPGKGAGEVVRTPYGSRVPFSTTVSDMLRKIETSADFWLRVLMEDRHDFVPEQGLSAQLHQVASAYGHFTENEDTRTYWDRKERDWVTVTMAQDFRNEVHELMRKSEALVNRPPSPRWMGPCVDVGCEGQLYLVPGRIAATCDECHADVDMGAIRDRLWDSLSTRLMRRGEIVTGVRMLGGKVTYEAVKKWVQRGRLPVVLTIPNGDGGNDELFRFSDALELSGIQLEKSSTSA